MERNPEIKKVLMSTGNKYILVACMTACHNFQNNGSVTWMGGQIMEREPGRFELYGENAMGKILMKVRKHIRKNAAEKAAERAGRGVAAAEAGAEASGSAE